MTENVSTESVDDSNIDDMNTAPLLVQLDIVSKQKEAYSELCQELREDKKNTYIQYEKKIKLLNRELLELRRFKNQYTHEITNNKVYNQQKKVYESNIHRLKESLKDTKQVHDNHKKLKNDYSILLSQHESQKNIINDTMIKLNQLEKAHKNMSQAFTKASSNNKELKTQNKELFDSVNELTISKKRNESSINSLRASLQKNLRVIKEKTYQYETDTIRELKNQIDTLNTKNDELSTSLEHENNKMRRLNENIASITEKAMSAMEGLDISKRELSRVNSKYLKVRDEKAQLSRQNESLAKEVTKQRGLQSKYMEELDKTKSICVSLFQEKLKLKQHIKNLQNNVDKLNNKMSSMVNLQKDVSQHESKVNGAEKEKRQLMVNQRRM